MTLMSPYFLLIALLACLPWVGPWKGRNIVQNVLRSLLFTALALALAEPHLEIDDRTPHRVLVLDTSASVTEASQQTLLSKLDTFGQETKNHLVVKGNPITTPSETS